MRSETEFIVFKGRWMAYRLFPLGDGLGVVFRDTTDRRIAEEQRDLLINELEHRVKNTLATVQSIASQTFRRPASRRSAARVRCAPDRARQRPRRPDPAALGRADLHDVVWSALRPHSTPDRERFTVEGPNVQVGPKCAVSFSMAVHELCHQRDQVRRAVGRGRPHRYRLERRGRSLPLAMARTRRAAGRPPARTGFGSRMIERALALQLSGKVAIDYPRRASSAPSRRRSPRCAITSSSWSMIFSENRCPLFGIMLSRYPGCRNENRSPLIRRRSRHGSGPVLPQNVPCRSKRIVFMLVSGSIS